MPERAICRKCNFSCRLRQAIFLRGRAEGRRRDFTGCQFALFSRAGFHKLSVMPELLAAGNIVDVVSGTEYPGSIYHKDGLVHSIVAEPGKKYHTWLLPGLVDAHVHIESSMLPPSEFARAAVLHGTVATVSDPHEIANVLGVPGINFMIRDGARSPVKFFFGAPSCVPATPFETAGASFDPEQIDALLARPEILYLAEVMNFPAVIRRDPRMLQILDYARHRGRKMDGHAPGVGGADLAAYAAAGIETDHECTTLEEGRERARLGMKVAIREGSAARNFEELWPLLLEFPEQCFFCSDDKHPDALMKGHINELLARAVAKGVPLMTAVRAATLHPVHHYRLPVGLLQPGDPADLLEVDSVVHFRCRNLWIDGRRIVEERESHLSPFRCETPNLFKARPKEEKDFSLLAEGGTIQIIEALDGQIVTGRDRVPTPVVDGRVVADPQRDLLKLTVINRYEDAPPALALVRGLGLRSGAMASSVAHDSHNLVAVGASDRDLALAVNLVIHNKGGLAIVFEDQERVLPLPIAGLMSNMRYNEVGRAYESLNLLARRTGCRLGAPFMLLSFLALPVIPKLKLTDRGLFDVEAFRPASLWE